MSQLNLTLPDGNAAAASRRASPGARPCGSIGEGLLRNALAVTVDGVHHPLDEPAARRRRPEVITRGSDEGLGALRHSTAHLLAWAVQELFPEVKFAFGPDIENGFYYDFDRASRSARRTWRASRPR